MLKLAQGLEQRGHAVDLVLSRAEGPLLCEVPDSVRLVDLGAGRVLRSLPGLVRYLRRERPVALISALHYVNLVALCASRLAHTPTRVVVTERNTLSEATRNQPRLWGQVLTRLIACLYPGADAIVSVSHGVADDLARETGLRRDRIRVIYNPIITPDLVEKSRVPLAHPWFDEGEPPVVLAVGRLRPQKDFGTLLESFARVRRSRPARLLILGEGSERPRLEALRAKLSLEADVELPGFVSNPHPYMVRAGVFVLSSRWEGLPGVLIEARSCGVPVVATDCPSGPREILRDGRDGQLVPVGDVDAMAQAIEAALSGRAVTPSPEGLLPFDQEVVLDQYLEVLLPPEPAPHTSSAPRASPQSANALRPGSSPPGEPEGSTHN